MMAVSEGLPAGFPSPDPSRKVRGEDEAVPFAIRAAVPNDAGALALVGGATFLETFAGVHTGAEIVAHCAEAHSVAAYEALLRGGAEAWVAETAGTGAVLGYAVLSGPRLPGAGEGDLELKRIYTLSVLHGGGAGRALLEACVGRARERGARRVMLGVFSENARAIAFYRRAGFERVGEYRFDVGGTGYLDWVMALVV